jgi:hypothetical protein
MKRRRKRIVGDIVAIPLGDGRRAYAMLLDTILMAFYDLTTADNEVLSVAEITAAPVAFRIWVSTREVDSGAWPRVGRAEPSPALLEAPWFYKQDPISGEVFLTKTGAEEVVPTDGQEYQLECAAVWHGNHVVDRLVDYFARRPNRWVDSMKIEESLRPR